MQSVGWITSDPTIRAQLKERHIADQVSGAGSGSGVTGINRGSSSDGLSVNSDQVNWD